MANKLFNEEEKKFIKDNVLNTSNKKLAEMFNKQFNTNITVRQIKTFKYHNNLSNGIDTRFSKNNRMQINRPIGSERKCSNGHMWIKVEEPNVWQLKHRYLYEKYKGKLKRDDIVIFADGDKTNFDLDNLVLISKREHFTMIAKNLFFKDKQLTNTGLVLAKLMNKKRDAQFEDLKENNYARYLEEKERKENSIIKLHKTKETKINELKRKGIRNAYQVVEYGAMPKLIIKKDKK